MSVRGDILALLRSRAPNWVPEDLACRRLSQHPAEDVVAELQALATSKKVTCVTDIVHPEEREVRHYLLPGVDPSEIRRFIRVGDVEVPRLLMNETVNRFPELFNESVERLAEYTASLESRFTSIVEDQQRSYWSSIVSVFGVFTAILAFVLTGVSKISVDPSLPFWQIVQVNLAQVLPIALVLAVFVLVLRWVVR